MLQYEGGDIAQDGDHGEALGTVQWKVDFHKRSNLSNKTVGKFSKMGPFCAIITPCLHIFTFLAYFFSCVVIIINIITSSGSTNIYLFCSYMLY
jgi:hypothetical protein